MKKHILSTVTILLLAFNASAQNFYIQEDFNGSALPTGWTNTAVSGTTAWSFGFDGSTTNSGVNNLDGTAMAFFDDDNVGAGSTNNRVDLLTPAFNNASSVSTTLEFDYNFREYVGPLDSFIVSVFDGTNWIDVFSTSVNDCGNYLGACSNNFPTANIDISAYNNTTCQVRFTYFDGNDWCWYVGIDNVVISSPFPNDVGVSQILNPISSCGLSSAETVQVQVRNLGSSPASNFSVVIDTNGTIAHTETITATIPAGDSLLYSFTGTLDMLNVGFYDLTAYTIQTTDGNNDNDSTIKRVENEPNFVPTFSDNLEGIDRWKVDGVNASWQRGAPSTANFNSVTSGTNAYVTRLNGNYNNQETSYLYSPCFNFSGAIGDPILSFSLNHRTESGFDRLTFEASTDGGVTWSAVNAGGVNPSNWFTTGAPYWQGNSGGWISVENVLTNFANQSSVNFRFKFSTDGSVTQEGVMIDDFSVRYPQPFDVSANLITYPSQNGAPLCGYATENVIVEIENKGASPLDTIYMFYRVDNMPVVNDTLIGPLLPNSLRNFVFSQRANFGQQRNYTLSVWASARNDGFSPNDSLLNRTVTGGPAPTSISLPVFENFDGFGWVRGTGGGGNSLVPAPWVRTPSPNVFNFTWHPWNNVTNSFQTGPDVAHSPPNFLYTETSTGTPPQDAILESPCINLGNASGAIMEFWYHKYGATMGDLFVEVNDGSTWLQLLRINGQTNTGPAPGSPWLKATVNLNQYAGQRIKLRWRGTRGGSFTGDMAIDDIEIFEPIPQDGKMSRLVSPVSGCTPSGTITVEVENFGSAPLTNTPVAISIDNGTVFRDTVPGTIAPGVKVNHTFPFTANFATKGQTYSIQIWTEVLGDSNLFNDRVTTDITNFTRETSYIEDFEGFVADPACFGVNDADVLGAGWSMTSVGQGEWHVQDMTVCAGTPGFGTGPNSDHTKGNGIFMYLDGNSGEGRLESPCLDFKSRAGAAMRFWYHKFGPGMTTMFVDVFADGVWNNGVFSIPGQTQTSEGAPWLEAVAKFNQFGGKDIKVRFRGTAGFRNEMAIDDISFFAPYGMDARMLAITSPESGCNINGASLISVEIDNFGVETLNSNGDSLLLYYQIDNLPPVRDTFDVALPSEQSATFTFTQPADLSIPGKTYYVKAWTAQIGEEDVKNDTLFNHKIFNQTKSTNYFENFETFRDANCDQLLGQVLQEGWAETSTSTHTWQVQSSLCGKGASTTPTTSTGPQVDRTTGSGLFIYTEADGSGTATFESPCIDLTNNTNPRFSFFYHKYGGNMNNLSVDVLFNGNWVNGVGSVPGQTQTSATAVWKNLEVDLSPYIGGLVQVRFRSVKVGFGTRSDMAIDDVFLYEAIPNDAGITEVIQPTGDACGLTSGNVVVNIENFGTANITPGQLIVQYNNNGGPYESDTIQQTIAAGTNLNYTFTTPVDLSNPGKQIIYARTILANDTLPQNNFASTTVINRQPGIPRYTQDFEELVQGANYSQDQLKGFTRFPANGGPGVFMWHVVSGAGPYIDGQPPMPPGPPTGPSGDHTFATNRVNGKGTYVLMETDLKQLLRPIPPTIPDAWLELPCGPMDFTASKNGSILLTYWYHFFGPQTGNLFVDVHNGTNWVLGIDVIRGQQQSDDTEPWLQRKVVLDRFNGLSAVRIRLRAETGYMGNPGDGRGGDMGVDDIEILDRASKDAAAFSLIDPASDCALTASERFKIRVQNLGTQDILNLNLGYQIVFTPYGGSPQVLATARDSSIGQTIVPLAFFDFSFQNIDMSNPGKYFIKYWTEYKGDEHLFNDTLTELITNTARPFPSCDDFSDLVSGHIAKDFKDGVLPNDWEANTQAYTWVATVEGEVPDLKGHTGGLNDVFMYAEDPAPYAGEARMESPCWDLNNTPAANLEFWYIMPSASGQLEIGVNQNGGGFVPIDTIKGAEGVARTWRKYEAVLADFVGANVQVQFRAFAPGGTYYAIDDVCIIRPEPQQMLFNEFVNPFPGRCFYSDSERVSIRVRNIGIDRIDSFLVVIALDEDIIGNPRGSNGFRDTIMVRPGAAPPFFNPGELYTFTINDPRFILDLSAYKDYYLHAWLLLDGDKDTTNNIRIDYQITHGDPEDLPYVVDFEDPANPLRFGRLVGNPTQDGFDWCIDGNGFPLPAWACDRRGVTGPELDHTLGPVDTTGHVLQANSAAGVLGDLIGYESPCVTLIGTTAPEMKFWYHMFGFDMGSLYLQINDDFGWVTVLTLVGQDPDQRINGRTPWKSRIVDLSAYRGKVIRYRFIAERGDQYAGNMAIDDIGVYDAAAIDIAPAGLNEPNTDSTYCYSRNNPLKIDVINNGSDALDFVTDTVCLTAIIFKDNQGNGQFVSIDTLTRCVGSNEFLDDNGFPIPLPRDSIVTLTMDSTFDMSDTGSFYRFIIIAEVDGDLIKSNDIKTNIIIKSQRKIGEIVAVLPNDTICFGDPVLVAIRNQFGAVRWEESQIRNDGSTFGFFIGQSTPFNRPNYLAFLSDSTTDIRARICPQLFISEGIDETTDSVRVDVIKPYRALSFDTERCENDPVNDTIKIQVQSNITGVNYYTSLTALNAEAELKLPLSLDYALKTRLSETDTFYLETLIDIPNILPSGLFCKSIQKVPAIRTIHTAPTASSFPTDTVVYCGPGSGSILNQGDVFTVDRGPLDANGIPVRQDTYSWDFTLVDGNGGTRAVLDSVNTQSFAVDPWRMDVNRGGSYYKISVDVQTDEGCEFNPGTLTDIYIKVLDDCTVGLQESDQLGSLEIFPNPVSDVLTINQSSVEIYNGSIFLLSAEGRLVESFEELTFGQLNQQIDMSKLPKGVYFIKIETDKGTTVRKVVKS
ncbi:choice-of-anchor J domain-containing protein [Vicingaceae bacterium]|nr:choice-of-anchor J domain-containing protein [Vicingaceae bacterium]